MYRPPRRWKRSPEPTPPTPTSPTPEQEATPPLPLQLHLHLLLGQVLHVLLQLCLLPPRRPPRRGGRLRLLRQVGLRGGVQAGQRLRRPLQPSPPPRHRGGDRLHCELFFKKFLFCILWESDFKPFFCSSYAKKTFNFWGGRNILLLLQICWKWTVVQIFYIFLNKNPPFPGQLRGLHRRP